MRGGAPIQMPKRSTFQNPQRWTKILIQISILVLWGSLLGCGSNPEVVIQPRQPPPLPPSDTPKILPGNPAPSNDPDPLLPPATSPTSSEEVHPLQRYEFFITIRMLELEENGDTDPFFGLSGEAGEIVPFMKWIDNNDLIFEPNEPRYFSQTFWSMTDGAKYYPSATEKETYPVPKEALRPDGSFEFYFFVGELDSEDQREKVDNILLENMRVRVIGLLNHKRFNSDNKQFLTIGFENTAVGKGAVQFEIIRRPKAPPPSAKQTLPISTNLG